MKFHPAGKCRAKNLSVCTWEMKKYETKKNLHKEREIFAATKKNYEKSFVRQTSHKSFFICGDCVFII